MARASQLLSMWAAIAMLTPVLGTPVPLLVKRSASPGMFAMPISRKSRSISKRDGFPVALSNEEYYYSMSVGVGSPPQSISLELDTGSSDTWAFSPSACSSVTCIGGPFYSVDPSQSTTFAEIAPGAFNISYHDGSIVLGDYVTDNLEMNGVTVESLEMGFATSATGTNRALMGVGFDINEASASPYPNIIDDMVSQGLIGGHVYSIWLDDLAANTGTIMFGGYDSSKFCSDLATVPMIPDTDGVYRSFAVPWTSLSITDTHGTTTYTTAAFEEPTILDSGTAVTRIDPAVFNILYQYFDVANSTDSNGVVTYTVDCGIASVQGSVDYGFPGVTISVPFSELALPIPGENFCGFGFIPDTLNLFGDTFLRSASVVYDLDQKEVGLAQTCFQ